MLFVRGKDKIVQYFAARNRRVISEERMDQPGSVFEIGVVSKNEANRFGTVKDMAPVTDDAIDEFNSFSNLRWLGFGRVDRQILKLISSFDITM